MSTDIIRFGIAIHGGAGAIPRETMNADLEAAYRAGLRAALDAGYGIQEEGGAALDAVETAVLVMEDSPLFNAGKGAVFTHDGTREQDASIMDGRTLECGAVAGLIHVKNPIRAARAVMEASENVLLAGAGAEAFAERHGLELVDASYFDTARRREQLERVQARERSREGARLVVSCGWHITKDGQDVYSKPFLWVRRVFGSVARLLRLADIDDPVEACRRVFDSDTQWTVVRGSDLDEGESQGLPVWSRHVGDPVLASNRTRRVDFAMFMVVALTTDEWIHEAPAIVGRETASAREYATQAR